MKEQNENFGEPPLKTTGGEWLMLKKNHSLGMVLHFFLPPQSSANYTGQLTTQGRLSKACGELVF